MPQTSNSNGLWAGSSNVRTTYFHPYNHHNYGKPLFELRRDLPDKSLQDST